MRLDSYGATKGVFNGVKGRLRSRTRDYPIAKEARVTPLAHRGAREVYRGDEVVGERPQERPGQVFCALTLRMPGVPVSRLVLLHLPVPTGSGRGQPLPDDRRGHQTREDGLL